MNMLVFIEKRFRLNTPKIIQTAINATALHNASQVKIGLSVPNNVYFFSVQFSAILARKNREMFETSSLS
jgi:hypothetical protein